MKTELGMRTSLAPEVDQGSVDALCEFLRGKGWRLAEEIETTLGINDRKVRVLAEHSEGRILSGQNGYRFFDRSTPIEEADIAAGWLESQARRMLKRAREIRWRAHRFARDPVPTTEQQSELTDQ